MTSLGEVKANRDSIPPFRFSLARKPALAFTSVYYSVLLINPLAFGRELSADSWALFEALYLSLNSLVGLDTVYPDSIRLVRNLVLTEGVWSELYMVLLIGRLLTKEDDLARSSQEKG